MALAVAAALVVAAVLTGSLVWSGSSSTAHSPSGASYAAKGKIVSFSAERGSVNIAHERIEGFMEAMTMEFQLTAPRQADGLQVGDRVDFQFTASPDAQLVLTNIRVLGR